MSVHHHPRHLLDFSPPPNTTAVAMEAPPPPSFDDHGQLLALPLDGGADMQAAAGGVVFPHRVLLADDAWPQAAVSLSLYKYNDDTALAAAGSLSSLFNQHLQQAAFAPVNGGHHHHHQHGQLLPASSIMQPPPFHHLIKSSKLLGPVKELLSEMCSLEGDLQLQAMRAPKAAAGKLKLDDNAEAAASGDGLWGRSNTSSLLGSMDLLELERRKARLFSMVEEVDRRYRRYREQMRSVEVSFEAVAGGGASQVYTRLALRAMSRHFRCLRDAVVAQVRKAAMAQQGERNGGGPAAGATKGETPRLKVLDQCLRQQQRSSSSFHLQPAVDNYPWRPQRGLPERAVAVLRAWLFEHFLHPYPNDVDKHILARQTGLSRSQVSNWFINARVRIWKPMIEDMYTEEVKQQSDRDANLSNPMAVATGVVKPENFATPLATAASSRGERHQLLHMTSGINPMTTTTTMNIVIDNGDGGQFHCYPNNPHAGGGAVSLTLGLQQQFVVDASSPMMMHQHQHQRSSFMLQEQAEDVAVLPYRNLMGQQLLHDLTG